MVNEPVVRKALDSDEENDATKESKGAISPIIANDLKVASPTANRQPFHDLSNQKSNTPKSIKSKSSISPIGPNPNSSVNTNVDFDHNVNLSYRYTVSLKDDDDFDSDDDDLKDEHQGVVDHRIGVSSSGHIGGPNTPSAASEMDYSGYAGSVSAAASDCWSHDSMDVDDDVNDMDDDIELESDYSGQSMGLSRTRSHSRANMNRIKKNIKFQFLADEHVSGISMNSVGAVRTGPEARLGVGSRPASRSQEDYHTDDNSRVTSVSLQMKRSRERRRKLRMQNEQATKANLLSEFRAFMGWTAVDHNTGRGSEEMKDEESGLVIGIQKPSMECADQQHLTPNSSRVRKKDGFEDNIQSPFSPHQVHGHIPFIVVPDNEDEISTIQGSHYNDSPQKDGDDYKYAWKNHEVCDGEVGITTIMRTNRNSEDGDKDYRKKEWIYLSLIAASIFTLTALVVIFIVHF